MNQAIRVNLYGGAFFNDSVSSIFSRCPISMSIYPLVSSISTSTSYLFKHSLGVWYPGGFLPPGPSVGEMLTRGELVHGDHGAAGLLPPQLQHGEQVQRDGAHVGQRANLQI